LSGENLVVDSPAGDVGCFEFRLQVLGEIL
jgi:hypothetical protein